MSAYGRKKKDPWEKPTEGKDWSNWGCACLKCGKRFYGKDFVEASRKWAAHRREAHPDEDVRLVGFATPVSFEAKQKARRMGTVGEAIRLEKLMDEYGPGWYLYALGRGAAQALDDAKRERERGPRSIEEIIEERKVEQQGWIHE